MPTCDAVPARGWIEIPRAPTGAWRARVADAAPLGRASKMLVVDQASRAREHVALRSMFAARKRVFVDLLKWDLTVLAGRYEVDRRDGPGATYLIVADAGGQHLASARLLPEPAAGLDPFSEHIFDGGGPTAGVAEVTHFCLSPDVAVNDRRRARDRLLYGLVDYALAHRIHRFVGIAERRWTRPVEELGWTCRRLGAVPSGCRRNLVGMLVDIDATTPARLAQAGVAAPTPPRQAT